MGHRWGNSVSLFFGGSRITAGGDCSHEIKRRLLLGRSRRGVIKTGESKLASNHFLMCSPQSGHLRDVHRDTQRREEGRRRQRCPRGKKGESKGKRQIQPIISPLSVLHSPEHTKRFTELGREEQGEGGDRADLVEKKESPTGERAIQPVI